MDGAVHEALLASRDNDDAALGHGVAAPVLGRIVPDDGAARHDDVAVEDGSPDAA